MIKRRLLSTLTIFLFVFIFVTFLIPSDLNAETREFWVDTSHWEDQEVWVTGGYFKDTQEKRWIDTSYTVTQGYWENYTKNVWVTSGYLSTIENKSWVDTSHWVKQAYNVWVNSGYTAYRDVKKWVDTSHYETRYKTVTGWVSCNKTFVYQNLPSEPKNVILSKWVDYRDTFYTGIINGTRYKYWKSLYYVLPANNIGLKGAWVIFKTKYNCTKMEATSIVSYSVWVSSGYWKTDKVAYWVDTSHYETRYRDVWVTSGYWKTVTLSKWIDTSHWETQTGKRWVDTSYTITQGYWEYYTEKVWVDTSHYEYKAVWVEDGFYTSPLHGEVIVEKSPRYIFTRWHKNQNNEECSMKLNVSWKVDNSNLSEGEEEKEIVRIYIYQDICRFNNKGVEKVTIFNGNVPPSVEGSINTITKFDYSGNEESILHIYLYAQNGESAHVYFSNPINGFRSINLMSEGSNSDANTWLGGNNYGKFEF